MIIKICPECRGQFPAPRSEQQICFTCHHWQKACQWIEKTIAIQRQYHAQVVALVEEEYAAARGDFGRSVFFKERPLDRAHLPIRVVRLEARIIAVNIDCVCGKMGKPPAGSALLEKCEDEVLLALADKERASDAWRLAGVWRGKFLDALRSVREEKRLWDAGREQVVPAGA